jgi:hypothetical protein
MNKEIKITQEIANQVEQMVLVASQMAEISKKYPTCWAILRKQFRLETYLDSNFIEDDIENVKVKLYADIISKNTIDKKTLEAKIVKEIKR